MRYAIALLSAASLLVACVSTRTTQISRSGTNDWAGKTVVLTARPRASFVAMTAGKAAFALVGALAMIEAGNTIVTENGVEDPAPLLGKALLDSAQTRYGVVPASIAPAAADTTDIAKLTQAALGADLLFDVQSMGSQFRYLPFDWSHYIVDSAFKFRVIDVVGKKLVAEGFCRQTTQDDKSHPTRDALLADRATLLKEILDAQRDKCLADFQSKVLNVGV